MELQLKEGQILVFKNKDKKEKKHPDYKGHLLLNGVEYDVPFWVNESKKGNKYMNGNAEPKQTLKPLTEEEKQERSERNNDLPF